MDFVLSRLAREALGELKLWAEELDRCDTEANAALYDLNKAPTEKARDRKNRQRDAIGTRVVVLGSGDHLARVRSIAGTLIKEHARDLYARRRVASSKVAMDAWKATLRVCDRAELVPLVQAAARATLAV